MSTSAADIQQIARLAGIELPEERAAALIVPLRAMQDGARQLAAIDYAEAEPGSRFRAPQTGPR